MKNFSLQTQLLTVLVIVVVILGAFGVLYEVDRQNPIVEQTAHDLYTFVLRR